MTQRTMNVTQQEQNVTLEGRDSSRARPRYPYGVVSRLSRVTETQRDVTGSRDSHYPSVRDHHAPSGGSSENFPRARFADVAQHPKRNTPDDGVQQGRGQREQLPQGSGIVLGVIFGLAAWALVAVVLRGLMTAGGAL